jgi:radical SAM family protein
MRTARAASHRSMRLLLVSPLSNASTGYSRLAASRGGDAVTPIASAAIATVAALAPRDIEVILCDEAITPIDFELDVDVVGVTANVSQALRAIDIARGFRARGKPVILGGPHVSLAPELFAEAADSLVVGEFEPVAANVFADMRRGVLKPRYLGSAADLATSPMPRWDLYPNDRTLVGVVQTSRGCPFECHFCDVIQYLGRNQRHKTDAQVVAEVQQLYDLGYNFISLADDNFTVHRKRAKSLLRALAAWNGADGRDFVTFATQLSIDAARDDEMLSLCHAAGLLHAFIGIESSDAANLTESKKRQNLRIDLAAEVGKVVRRGLRVEASLMVGFDHDDLGCFERQFDFAMTVPTGAFMVSVLVAPVATPLHASMVEQGRIVSDEVMAQFPSANLITNIIPAQMSREQLYVGAKWLISRLFAPEHFYTRIERMSALLAPPPWVQRAGVRRYWHPSRRRSTAVYAAALRELARRDPEVAQLIPRVRALTLKWPEIRDPLNDALSHYLITLRSYDLEGVYDRVWARLAAPPFGTAAPDARIERIRRHA